MVQDRKDPDQDALLTGQPSGSEGQDSSGKLSPDVFTPEETEFLGKWYAEGYRRQRHGEQDKQISTGSKWLNMASIEIDQKKAQIAELESDIQELKQTDSGDLADLQVRRRELLQREQALKLNEQNLQWATAEKQELIERAEKQAQAETAKQIAEEFGVNSEALLDQPTPDAMRTLAQKLADAAAAAKPAPTKPDSGLGSTGDAWRDLTAEQKILRAIETKK